MDRRTLLFVVIVTISFFVMNIFIGRRAEPPAPIVIEEEVAATEPAEEELATTQLAEQKFYVLQTPYQQLVFSNIGGAVTEINLPFESESHPTSVVKEIGVDREMLAQAPASDYYPDSAYFTPGQSATGPFTEHEHRQLGGYYPLLRRTLVQEGGAEVLRVPPEFYALNIISKYPEMASQAYQVTHFDERSIVFEMKGRRRTIRKSYTLPDDPAASPYVFNLKVEVEGDRDAGRGLWLTSGVPDIELLSGRPVPSLKLQQTRNSKGEVEKVKLPKEGQPVHVGSIHPNWLSNSNGFFTVIVNPLDEVGAGYRADYVPGLEVPSRLVLVDHEYDRYRAGTLPGYRLSLPLRVGGGAMKVRVFAGPQAGPILRTVDTTYTDPVTGQGPGYLGTRSFRGYFAWIAEPFSKFLLIIMRFCYFLTGSWGFSIILLTVVLRLLLYPLSAWSMKSMRRMQQLAPEVSAIQARHKKDPRKGQAEVMALYRSKKVNPFSGCLPLLIQMPFLIAMFNLLKSTFELRGAVFIPGWIDNLTAPDVLFSWSVPIFFIGTEFHLLPFLMGGVMVLQQKLSSTLPKDKSLWTDQQRQQKLMGKIMVVIFTVMFYRFASGLNLYFISSMALGILQQWITNRQLDRQKGKVKGQKARA